MRAFPVGWNVFYSLSGRPWPNTFRTIVLVHFWSTGSGNTGALFQDHWLLLVHLSWEDDRRNEEVILCARKKESKIFLLRKSNRYNLFIFLFFNNIFVLFTLLHQVVFLQIWGWSWCPFDDYFPDDIWKICFSHRYLAQKKKKRFWNKITWLCSW